MITATINTRKASVRACPYIPEISDEVIGFLDEGEKIKVDTTEVIFDWTDNTYYKCETPVGDGYISTNVININRRRNTNHERIDPSRT